MEADADADAGLEWENLALYAGKPLLRFSMSQPDLYHVPAPAPAPHPAKRSRASYHNMQNPCCQVEGCNLDLKLAKDYHRRHRICETHSKTPKVVVQGMERRFCQQCSRFHDLSEFDDNKRSCRRRLSDHNARRRRVQPDLTSSSSSSGFSPAFYTSNTTTTDHRQHNVLLNGLPVSLSNSSWDNSHMEPHHSTPRILDQCVHGSSMAPELLNAHSLLSSNSWSLNEAEPIVQGNSYSPVLRHPVSDPDPHHFTLFHTPDQIQPSPLNMHNAAPSHHPEYHLFKSPYNSTNFYSTQRTL